MDNRQAIVAAIDAIADRRAEFGRDVALVLDRQIRNAAARIDLVRRRKRSGRTDVQAIPARTAMVGFRLVGLELECGEDRTQK